MKGNDVSGRLRKRLKDGEIVIGGWLMSGSPEIGELLAISGFDFIGIDTEHAPVDLHLAHRIMQAVQSSNPECSTIVRLPGNDYNVTKRYLDSGADGVIAPLINSGEEAKRLVSSVKYPPNGARGVGFARCNGYGQRFKEYLENANDETLVAAQIEHIDGVENIEDILNVDGIDAVFIGPYDLSASMGITEEFDNPRFVDAKQKIFNACQANGVIPGLHIVPSSVEDIKAAIDSGYRFLVFSTDMVMLSTICNNGLSSLRRYIGRATRLDNHNSE